MQIKEIKTGEYFTIENTPTYPKLKLDIGYVDMRDEIVNKDNLFFEAETMSNGKVYEEFAKYGMIPEQVEDLREELLDKFNH